MNQELYSLKQFVFSQQPLEPAVWDDFAACWSEVSYGRKQVLTRSGATEQYLYFVLEGVQRAFYLHRQREATVVFTYAPSFSGILDSLLLQKPSSLYLETLTSSRMLRMRYPDLMQLMRTHTAVDQWVRQALTRTLSGTLDRQVELLCFSAEEKFRALLQRSPHLLQLIPHKYLASYIGIDATNFSKLLGTVRL